MTNALARRHGLHLLPVSDLLTTGPFDHAEWVYRPFLGWIERLRFHMLLKLLPEPRPDRLLEIGYGSGIFLPELARRTEHLHGLDIHPYPGQVAERLRRYGITAELQTGSAEAIPFPDGHFDVVVAISALEFLKDPLAGAREIRRVLAPNGRLVFVTPGRSRLADLGLWLLTRKRAQSEFEDRRDRLLPALESTFTVEAQTRFPPGPRALKIFRAFRMKPRA